MRSAFYLSVVRSPRMAIYRMRGMRSLARYPVKSHSRKLRFDTLNLLARCFVDFASQKRLLSVFDCSPAVPRVEINIKFKNSISSLGKNLESFPICYSSLFILTF